MPLPSSLTRHGEFIRNVATNYVWTRHSSGVSDVPGEVQRLEKKKDAKPGLTELRELRQLRDENARLKRVVADLTLDVNRRGILTPWGCGGNLGLVKR